MLRNWHAVMPYLRFTAYFVLFHKARPETLLVIHYSVVGFYFNQGSGVRDRGKLFRDLGYWSKKHCSSMPFNSAVITYVAVVAAVAAIYAVY